MITIRKSADRGGGNHGWLDSKFSFSFADYHDPRHMGYGSLRVINDDHIAPGAGFPTHPHRDMEILTWVLDGAVAHRDSEGNQAIVRPGELQRMSAGTGIRHSEFNASPTDPLHLLQIWILPERRGLAPGYEQTAFTDLDGKLRLGGWCGDDPPGRGVVGGSVGGWPAGGFFSEARPRAVDAGGAWCGGAERRASGGGGWRGDQRGDGAGAAR